MKKRIILFVIFMLILTGCSSEYTLELSNKGIKETLIVDILDSEIPSNSGNSITEMDDQITPFINEDQYPFLDDQTKKYNKEVTKENGVTKVKLDYEYKHDEYPKSTVYNTCFQNSFYESGRRYHELRLGGTFYCLYGDQAVINIKTNNLVKKHNADKVSGNVYTWIIDLDNVSDTEINIVVSKWPAFIKPVVYVIIGAVFLSLILFGYIMNRKMKNIDTINDI